MNTGSGNNTSYPFPGEQILLAVTTALAAMSLLAPLAFRGVLATKGFELFDIWGGGHIHPIPPGAASFVTPGKVAANLGCLTALLASVPAFIVLAIALGRKRRHLIAAAIVILMMALSGFLLSTQIGFTIAGV